MDKKRVGLEFNSFRRIACVCYEIGCACLSSNQRMAKIAKNFLRSPLKTAFKKIAQCLWAPVMLEGALYLVCLITKACWNQYLSSFNKSSEKKITLSSANNEDCLSFSVPFLNYGIHDMPNELIKQIFSHLTLHDLGISRLVNKEWEAMTNDPHFWKLPIYQEITFTSKNWIDWDKELVKDLDLEQEREEIVSIPENIVQQLRLG